MTPRARRTTHDTPRAKHFALFFCALLCCFAVMGLRADAATLEDYRARALKATEAMEDLQRAFVKSNDVNSPEFVALEKRTFQETRALLPAHEKIESAGVALDVDNRWLHDELELYAKIAAHESGKRGELISRAAERLRALDTRLAESVNAAQAARDKEAEKGRLNAILQRPEYNKQAAEDSALARLWKKFKEWLNSLLPESDGFGKGATETFSIIARLFVFALAAAVFIYVIWKYGVRLLPRNRVKKKLKSEARVVLGERLAPGQTSADLIEQAEALARSGDLRGAIRKAYIAVLVELGERRTLRLAAHKTNRDYLLALRRDHAALYGDMQPLTHNYERHWYGFAPATDADWYDFQSRCRQLTQ